MEIKEEKKIFVKFNEDEKPLKKCMICKKKIREEEDFYDKVCECNEAVHHICLYRVMRKATVNVKKKECGELTGRGWHGNRLASYTCQADVHCPECSTIFSYQPGFALRKDLDRTSAIIVVSFTFIFNLFITLLLHVACGMILIPVIIESIVMASIVYILFSERTVGHKFVTSYSCELILIPISTPTKNLTKIKK